MKINNIFPILLALLISLSAKAHDDVAYINTAGLNIDYGNNSQIDKTLPANHIGSVATLFGDYNGDGYLDLCKVNTEGTLLQWNWCLGDANGNFDINNPIIILFGIAANDQCVVGDFNGDGKTDIAVARTTDSSNSLAWYIDYAPCDRFADIAGQTFGLKGDIALSGDFNADGVADICVYRPSESEWHITLSSLTGGYPIFQGPYAISSVKFGIETDMPFVGDFNGDGYDDMALYRKADNKVYINLFKQDKPKMEGFAGLDLFGTIDMTINSPVSNISDIAIADFDRSRPQSLPLATIEELGKKVQLRHGWTCIFDNSLDVDKWIQAWQAVGINTLEYHPWMRAHDEIAPQGETWNAYVGDDRLWTSKAKMKEKINKFRAIGGRSIGYTGIYAAAPAFAYNYPDWAMRYTHNGQFITYGGTYLNLMSTNENVDKNYTVNGKSFKNFNDYFVDQAKMAQQEYNWDGWRWDWYGLPGMYECEGLAGTGDFSYEIGPLTDKLDSSVKNIRADVTTTTLQLPNASGNVPFDYTAAVVDHQFMELWPDAGGTGEKYSDLYREIYKAKSKYPDKPVFANFYPPSSMNLSTSWPLTNIRYQFATSLSAGGYPAAQVVDGIAGFTDPVPFHAVNYPVEVLTEIAKWNKFTEAYGAYFYYSNERYLIRDSKTNIANATNATAGLEIKTKERIDKQTRKTDAVIINLIDYGQTKDLKWIERNNEPSKKSVKLTITLPVGFNTTNAWLINAEGKQAITLTPSGDKYTATISELNLFASLIISANMPAEPQAYATSFPDYKFEYDAAGETLNKDTKKISVLDDQKPLVIENFYNNKLCTWQVSENAYSGNSSIMVNPGKLYFTSNNDNAIRIPVKKYNKFRIAIKGNNSTAAWFGFRLLKPSTTSSVWEMKDIYYRIGADQPGLPNIVLDTNSPQNDWVLYERDILEDVYNHPYLTLFWQNAIIIGVYFGPVDSNVSFDALEFMTDDYDGINEVSNTDTVQIFFNPAQKQFSVVSHLLKVKNINMYDSLGKLVAASNTGNIDYKTLSSGVYVIDILTNEGNITKKIII